MDIRANITKEGRLILILLLILISINIAKALPGNSCTSTPCTCGANCNNGNEAWNGYNTIDSCRDGPEYSYEYVQDITVTDLNSSIFKGGDTIEIDAYVDCDPDGDEISFAYYNGSAWKSFYDVTCNYDGKIHYYRNITLDDVQGNQTIRITLAYSGTTGMVCSYNYDTIYSDTDDISFYVYPLSRDIINPNVTLINPIQASFLYYENLIVNISANVTDNVGISNVSVNISWAGESQLLAMTNITGNQFLANFTNTGSITRYDFTILAYDTTGNLNDTVAGYFYVNATSNITFISPLDQVLYPSSVTQIEYEVMQKNLTVYSSYVDINEGESTNYGDNKKISCESGDNISFENGNQYDNMSQSFLVDEDMYVANLSIKIKKTGDGASDSRLEIRNSSQGMPSSIILAYANISPDDVNTDSEWLDLNLNQTIVLKANTSYWLFLTPNGSSSDFFSWESAGNGYALGNYSNNNSRDLMFRVLDKFRFNTSFEPYDSQFYFKAYAYTTKGTIESPIILAFYDFDYPEINDYFIAPDDENLLKPGTTINFSADVTDNLELAGVILRYMLDNDSEYNNKTMSLESGLYSTNLTIPVETNLTYHFLATDTSYQQTDTPDENVEIVYQKGWRIDPVSYNTTGVMIEENVTVGNLTIFSESDFPYLFNLSYNSVRSVFFNNSPSRLISLGPHANATVVVKAMGASIVSEDQVILNITNLNESAMPSGIVSNFTLVSFLSGPYLKIDIIEYNAEATQGDHIASIKARISNVGNETANNLTVAWVLPQGWTSRNNLQVNYSNLTSGGLQIIDYKITADVAQDAPTGSQLLSISVNCSQGIYDSDSRTVVISSPSSPIVELAGGSSGSSGNIAPYNPVIISQDDFSLDEGYIRIPRGISSKIIMRLTNNVSKRGYHNLTFEIDGLFKNFYSILPSAVDSFSAGELLEVNVSFDLPDYFSEGISTLKLIVHTSNTEKPIVKEFNIIVYDNNIVLQDCLNTSLQQINALEKKGVDIKKLRQGHATAILDFNASKFSNVKTYCDSVEQYAKDYASLETELQKIKELADSLKKIGYNTGDIEEYINLVKESLLNGDLENTNKIMGEASLLLSTKAQLEKPLNLRLAEFISLNKTFLISLLIIIPLISVLISKLLYITKTETRIKKLEGEKTLLLEQIKIVQDDFFNKHFITRKMYHLYIESYRKRIGQIEIAMIKLKLRQKNYLNKSSTYETLTIQRNEILNLLKTIQEEYYVKKTIDADNYEKIESIYSSTINNLDEQINTYNKLFDDSKIENSETDEHTSVARDKITEPPIIQKTEEKLTEPKEESKDPVQDIMRLKELYEKKAEAGKEFKLANGEKFLSIKELYENILLINDHIYNHHVNHEKNDFASWIKVIFDDELGDRLSKKISKSGMKDTIKEYFGLQE